MRALIRPAVVLFVVLSVLTGLLYPLLVTAIGQAVFPDQASGSLVWHQGKAVGSLLIGQSFNDPSNFWGRPSATGPMSHNPMSSGGSNLGPSNPALVDAVKGRVHALRAVDPDNSAPVPVDLVTTSASGLDPHISVAAAHYQAARVARARGLSLSDVQGLIEKHTEGRGWTGLGEPRVHVLRLNLALAELALAEATLP